MGLTAVSQKALSNELARLLLELWKRDQRGASMLSVAAGAFA